VTALVINRPAVDAGPRPALPVRVSVLGPLQIHVGGREVHLPQAKLRMLFAALVLRENRVTSNETLIDELWDDSPPPTALRALRVYVSQLRKFLAVNGFGPEYCQLVTQPPGYRVILADGVLDRHLFEDCCREGNLALAAGDLHAASDWFRHALRLHTGAALADLRAESRVMASTAQWLNELRLGVLIRAVDLDLQLGRHLNVISELTELLTEHPLNEALHARLMIALYRSGRTGDALAVFRSLRRTLVDELGAEPGPEIRRIHQSVLAADPVLEQSSWTL